MRSRYGEAPPRLEVVRCEAEAVLQTMGVGAQIGLHMIDRIDERDEKTGKQREDRGEQ